MPLLPPRAINFSDTQPALGTTPADADNGTATFTLHRDITYAAVGQVSQPATLQDAVLNVTCSYNDAVAGAATFSIQVTGNPTTGFTTTVTETGTNAFATLNVTVTADDGWLDDFVNSVDQTIDAQFGVPQSDNPGGSVVSSQAGTAGGTTITHGPDGSTTTQIFDSANHLLSDVTTDSNGNVLTSVTYTYDTAGNQTSETNGIGSNASTTLWTYDSAGNKTSETLGAGTADAATTTYGYTNGNLTSVTDPDGNTTLYSYDVNGRQISMTDPLGNVQTQGYDAAGQLAWVIDRDSQLTTYAYDDNGNLITETMYAGATDTTAVVDTLTWTYNADGTVATAGNDQGTYVFQYDSSGRVIHVDEPSGVSLTFGYDSAGNRVLVEDSLGGVEQSSYNAAGQLMSRTLTQGDVVLRIDFTYTTQGQIATETRYSDAAGTDLVATTTYTYDPLGNIASIVSTDASGNPIANYAYTTDAAGDLTSQTENGVTSDFDYDAQGELIGDTIGETTTGSTGDSSGEGPSTGAATTTTAYSYDANGNRTNPGYVTGPDNELLSDGTWNYSYDANGNEIEKVNVATGVTWTYAYDDRNEMTEAKEWSENPSTYGTAYIEVQEDFKYDVYGNRVEQDLWSSGPATSSAVVTKFAVDGWNPAKGTPLGNENFDVWADLTGTGALQTRYLRGDAVDQLLARVDNNGSSLSPYWELTDRLGSVRDVIDNNTGAVQDAITYDSYGNITNQTNPAYLGRYAWTGREFDVETDLQYNRARYYDPSTGRWMSQDPLGFDAGDSNLYRYVKNRPTEATDPSGQEWTQDEVQQLLKDTKGGAAILAALNKYTVYRVEFIKFQFKERANIGEAWPKTWKTDYTKGLELDAQDTPDKKANIYIPNKVVDTFLGRKDPPNLMDMSAASAAMAIVHEVAHAQQDPKASSKDREVGAFTAQAEFLINNPDFRRMLPAAERDSYNKLIKKVDGKEVPDKQAIVQLWIKVYNKFAVVGEKNAKRETLSITKEPETNWELGDPKKKIKLENWK